MTPGVTQETVGGMSQAKIGSLIDAMRHERYGFSPGLRVHITKRNGNTRSLGLLTGVAKRDAAKEIVRLGAGDAPSHLLSVAVIAQRIGRSERTVRRRPTRNSRDFG